MKQLSKTRSTFFHLYPGVLITLGFIFLAPLSIKNGYPPQFGMLLSIVVVAIPVLYIHLRHSAKEEGHKNITGIIGYHKRLSSAKLILYSLGLVAVAFLIWGITQPVSAYINKTAFGWLPGWFTVQDFAGYSIPKVKTTLMLNLLLNGIIAPIAEEVYFRGYLLPRMNAWGKYAFIMNALLFSLYHFWQPGVYFTLIFALLPMVYMVYKTQDIRLGILSHSLMNIIGALLALGLLYK